MKELTELAPTKDELETHDGVVFFPKELLPPDFKQDPNDTAFLPGFNLTGLPAGKMPPFFLKSKQLNLKLKFKHSHKSNSKQG